MEIDIILAKIVGILLLVWTIISIYKHVKEVKATTKAPKTSEQTAIEQSATEQVLNSILLYVWLFFMLCFSIGMIVNN